MCKAISYLSVFGVLVGRTISLGVVMEFLHGQGSMNAVSPDTKPKSSLVEGRFAEGPERVPAAADGIDKSVTKRPVINKHHLPNTARDSPLLDT